MESVTQKKFLCTSAKHLIEDKKRRLSCVTKEPLLFIIKLAQQRRLPRLHFTGDYNIAWFIALKP
jgi:hypothetical protein